MIVTEVQKLFRSGTRDVRSVRGNRFKCPLRQCTLPGYRVCGMNCPAPPVGEAEGSGAFRPV